VLRRLNTFKIGRYLLPFIYCKGGSIDKHNISTLYEVLHGKWTIIVCMQHKHSRSNKWGPTKGHLCLNSLLNVAQKLDPIQVFAFD